MPDDQTTMRFTHRPSKAEKAAWDAIQRLMAQLPVSQLPDSVKRAAALALALLEGGEHASEAELRGMALMRDEPIKVADARAVQARTERVLTKRFGGLGFMPATRPDVPGYGLTSAEGEITAVVFSKGDAVRLSRATGSKIVSVLVRKAPSLSEAKATNAAAAERRKLMEDLREVPPGGSLSILLPATPMERRAKQLQASALAGQLWGESRSRSVSEGDRLVVTRLERPMPNRASASARRKAA